ncbi:MAG TPA: hypothetical protein VLL98_01950 [Rickettsiales bacterium]|nr:hypothetical protein [Rickettsiales bacterium]
MPDFKDIDIVFLSFGDFSKKIEDYFSFLKEKIPNIKRIHGIQEKSRALSIAASVVDSEVFAVIYANELDINKEKLLNFKYDFLFKKKDFDIINSLSLNSNYHDILYLTYNEDNAESLFLKLLKKYPNVKRLHGVKGLTRAFKISSFLIDTEYYVLIDGDNEVKDDFDLNNIELPKEPDVINLYMAQNPVNDLIYGYGGIKVCPTKNFRNIENDRIDPVASGGIERMNGIRITASITKFNTSPFNSWKAGFREAVMLTAQIDPEIKMECNKARQKLEIWKNTGFDRDFGKWCIKGACEGEKYAEENFGNLAELSKINDPVWLKNMFKTNKFNNNAK